MTMPVVIGTVEFWIIEFVIVVILSVVIVIAWVGKMYYGCISYR